MSQSRSRARERKQEREQQRKRTRQLTIAGLVVVAVVVLVGLFAVSNVPTDSPIAEDVIDRYANYIQDFTEEGFPILGNPDAPNRVREYSSFSCPSCLVFHDTVFPRLIPLIESGQISFEYVPLQTAGNNAGGAARAALCAGEQGKFWEMHDVLFDWQDTFAGAAFTSQRLTGGAEGLGLDMGAFNACFNSEPISDTLNIAQQQGVASTPTIQVNGTTVSASFEQIQASLVSVPASQLEPGIITEEAAPVTDETADTEEAAEESATDEEAAEEASEDEMTEEAADESTADEETAEEATEEAGD